MASKTMHADARSLMNPHAPALPLGPFGRDIAAQLVSGLFSGIPVVDQDRRVLGIVTQANLQSVRGEDLAMVRADQIMTVPSTYLQEDMTREEVGSILNQEHVMQLPVLRHGKFVGVITRWMVFGKGGLVQDSTRRGILGPSGHSHQADQQTPLYLSALETASMRRVKTLLVVDDDPVIAGLLCDMLEGMNYRVMAAGHGQEAMRMIPHQPVDGILLDLDMPIMDGRTMLDELRWKNSEIPVVVMSGGVDHFTLQNLLREGAQGWLMKPFTLKSLQAQCERIFGPASGTLPFRVGSDRQANVYRSPEQPVAVGS